MGIRFDENTDIFNLIKQLCENREKFMDFFSTSSVLTFVSLLGVFFAGWLAATDKNRNELYKRKLDAHEGILHSAQSVIMLIVVSPFNKSDDQDENITNARIALFQSKLSKSLYISREAEACIMAIYSLSEESDPEHAFDIFRNLLKQTAKDLNIEKYSTMSRMALGDFLKVYKSNQFNVVSKS